MSNWGSRGMSVDSFDGYDPTPYSGGYDLSLTYGRPLQPSDDICYPFSAAGDVDLERPQYSSGSQSSALGADNIKKSDCYGFSGFPIQPQPVPNTGYPGYGHQSYGHGGDGGAFDYGSRFGGRPQFPEYGSAYGQGYGQRPQLQEFRPEYESGRKPHHGSEYGREGSKHYGDEGYGASEYQMSEKEGYGRQGFGGNNDYVYGGNTSYVRPSFGVGYKNSSYGGEHQNSGYRKPSYSGGEEGEGYGHSKYGNDSDDVEKKHGHHKHHHRHY